MLGDVRRTSRNIEDYSLIVDSVIAALSMILMERWRCPIVPGRCAGEGRIVERAEDVITVRLFSMTVNASKREADAFLMLVGNVLPDDYLGRDVQIGCSYDGLQGNTA